MPSLAATGASHSISRASSCSRIEVIVSLCDARTFAAILDHHSHGMLRAEVAVERAERDRPRQRGAEAVPAAGDGALRRAPHAQSRSLGILPGQLG